MPKVPTLNGPSVAASTGNTIQIRGNADANSFGASPDDIGRIAKIGGEIYQQEKRKADQIRVMDADRQLAAFENQLLYNPETGYMNRKGSDAFDSVQSVDEAYAKKVSEIEGSLTTDEQRAAFRNTAGGRQVDINRSMSRHVSEQRNIYDTNQTKAYIETERDAALANPYDLQRVQTSLIRQKNEAFQFADRNGLSPEVMKNTIQEIETKTHSGVINQMLASGNDMAAKSYFDQHKDQIYGDEKTRITKNVEEGTLRGTAQKMSDDIFGKTNSLTQAMVEVKKIEDPKLRDETQQRVRQAFTLRDEAERDYREKSMISAGNIIDKYGDVNKIPPAQWNRYSPSEKSSLRAYARSRVEGNAGTTNWDKYYTLKLQAANDPTNFNKVDLFGEYKAKGMLGDSEFKELVNLQGGTRSGDEKTKKQLDGFRSDESIVKDMFIQMGFDEKKDGDLYGNFRRQVDEQIMSLQEHTKRKASNKEVQEIVDNLSIKVVTDKGMLWNTEKRAFELNKDDKIGELTIDQVPRAEKMKILDTIKRRGEVDSDDLVLRYYRLKLENQRAK